MTAEAITIESRVGPYTVDDVLELFPEDRRVELLEGALIVSPFPTLRHQLVGDGICRVLHAARPPGIRVVTSVNVRLRPEEQTLLGPDVAVIGDEPPTDRLVLDASELLAVVEVVSPSSRSHDRLVKAARYAEAGIPCYWRVELDPFPRQGDDEQLPVVIVHDLVGTTYREAARLTAGVVGSTDLPFPVTLDPADLLR